MKMVNEEKISKIKNRAIIITNVASVRLLIKKLKATIAYYDPKNDIVVINESFLNKLSEDCLTYILVHELVHKLTNAKSHGAKFLNKLLSFYGMDDIIKYDTEIIKAIQFNTK